MKRLYCSLMQCLQKQFENYDRHEAPKRGETRIVRSVSMGFSGHLGNPCLNGGTCVQYKMQTSHVCLCPVGVSGTNCEIRLTCWSNPCENGGTCIEYVDSYNYSCPASWVGSH